MKMLMYKLPHVKTELEIQYLMQGIKFFPPRVFIIFCIFCRHDVLKGYSRSGQFITMAKCATKILSWLLNTWNGFKGEPSKKHKRQNHMLTNTIDPTDLGECIQRFNDGNTISSGKIGCISANISGPNWKYIRAKWDWNFHNKIPFSKLLMCHSSCSLIRGKKLICSVWVLPPAPLCLSANWTAFLFP